MKTLQHRMGEIMFHYVDRLGDMVPEDNAERIVGEFMPRMHVCLARYMKSLSPHNWICFCGVKSPAGEQLCDCFKTEDWQQDKLQ